MDEKKKGWMKRKDNLEDKRVDEKKGGNDGKMDG